jgi:PilZ domain
MGLSVPVHVKGHDPDGTAWEEMTTTEAASYGGASFPLRHPHGAGQVFLLSLPLPRNFRKYDLAETSYRTYALVRNTRLVEHEPRIAGVMFIGKNPPKGYAEKPGGRFRLASDAWVEGTGSERRRFDRMQLFVNLKLQRSGPVTMEEQTVTENLSPGGARVFTTLPIARGETLVVCDLDDKVRTEAAVRNVYIGPDGVTRLNLQFPDSAAFERLLAAAGSPPLPHGEAS